MRWIRPPESTATWSSLKRQPLLQEDSYWKGLLETKIYGLWRLLGWTESVPYDRTAAYSIADSLGVSYDKLPCAAVVLPNSPGAQQVVPLSGDLTQSF